MELSGVWLMRDRVFDVSTGSTRVQTVCTRVQQKGAVKATWGCASLIRSRMVFKGTVDTDIMTYERAYET